MAPKHILVAALAALFLACVDRHHSRCCAAIISTATEPTDRDAATNPSDPSAVSNSTATQPPACPPLDLLIVNPIDIAFSRDCVLTYLARAFSKDLVPVNKKAIVYAVNRLERALTAIQMLNQQMQACDGAVRAATNPRGVMDAGMLPPPGVIMVPRGVPPPPGSIDGSFPPGDGSANTPPSQAAAPTASVIGRTVVLPPGSAVVVPTADVSAAAAKQAVISNNNASPK